MTRDALSKNGQGTTTKLKQIGRLHIHIILTALQFIAAHSLANTQLLHDTLFEARGGHDSQIVKRSATFLFIVGLGATP